MNAVELKPVCPAAWPLAGPPTAGPSVICGVMRTRFDLLDSILDGQERGVLLTMRDDPSSVAHLCCGTGIPLVTNDDERHPHYTNCILWQLDREIGFAEKRERDAQRAALEADIEEIPEGPSLEDLIYGRASLEEYAEMYAGPSPVWTEREERKWAEQDPRVHEAELVS